MIVGGKSYRTIWVAADGVSVEIIDQTKLPHEFVVARLASLEDAARAIADMLVRGAPLIGVTAAYGLCLALQSDASDSAMIRAAKVLEATRPTAVNLRCALCAHAGAAAARFGRPSAPAPRTRWPRSSPTRTSRRTTRLVGTASKSSRPRLHPDERCR